MRDIVGRISATLLANAKDREGRPVFKGLTILLPPADVTVATPNSVFSDLLRATLELRGFPIDDDEEMVLRRIVRVLHAPSLVVADLVRVIEEQGQRRLIAVTEASRFQDANVQLPTLLGATAARLPEDRWTPHVTALCQQLLQAIKRMDSYAVVHVPEIPARKEANRKLLISVDDCYVLELTHENDVEEVLATRNATWISMALQGRLEDVKAELEQLDLSEGGNSIRLSKS